MQNQEVYVVIGGWHYEGEHFNSLKLFDCKSSAEEYKQQLTEDERFDYALMEVREICFESALAA